MDFDLLVEQENIRQVYSTKALFGLLDSYSRSYERRELSRYHYEEIKTIILAKISRIKAVEDSISNA